VPIPVFGSLRILVHPNQHSARVDQPLPLQRRFAHAAPAAARMPP
jgi:hypothetical protein